MLHRTTVFVVMIGAGVALSLTRFATPEEITNTAIVETAYRIHLYARAHGTLPTTLDELPERANHANSTTDGWGRELHFGFDSDGVITLQSLGRDGRLGGTGANRDTTRSLRTRDANGRFIAADDDWIATSWNP